MPAMIGRSLRRYRILSELGRGGMGVVYRALDESLQREVALKVLSPELVADPELHRRFLQEARAAAALSHPGVAVVHEIDQVDGVTYIAMELVGGEPLARALRRGPLDPGRALELGLEIAEALGAGHARGIVHRDVKPGNVVLTDAGHAKLIDFGLAKSVPVAGLDLEGATPPRGHTDPGRLVGTAAYMSPEQARGRPVDARSDVFSFGALLFEMLAGRPAFERESGIETLHAVLKEPAPALPFGAPELQALLERCLAKEPQARFASARELADELRGLLERLPAEPRPARTRASSVAPSPARLRVLVVDDEEPARAVLREYLAARPDVEVVGECRNGFEAVKAVAELRPELVFLDVQMPKLDGFEVLELIGHEVAVVFVTAFDEHALRAFEVNAVDYLLKPTAPERLATALERARLRLGSGARLPVQAVLDEVRQRDRPADRVLVRDGPRVHVLAAGALDYAEAQDDYVCLRSGAATFLKQQTMADLERSLDPQRFVRIHRRYLLNVERLARLEVEGETRTAVLKDGTRLPISRAGHQRLKALL